MLITSDLHLTSNENDSYRLGILLWLAQKAKDLDVNTVFILGDLTDKKDNHPSSLVNRIVSDLKTIANRVENVVILKGNHDYIDPENPFFKFLSNIDKISFIVSPSIMTIGRKKILLLPHSQNPYKEWGTIDMSGFDLILMHQTIKGAIASNGMRMDGYRQDLFSRANCRIISGDIHVPQVLGRIEYVGSPYRIKFGDNFTPRLIHIDHRDFTSTDLYFPCLSKHVIEISSPEELESIDFLNKGDQVKIRMFLGRHDYHKWPEYRDRVRRYCGSIGMSTCSIELVSDANMIEGETPSEEDLTKKQDDEVLVAYCEYKNVPDFYVRRGLEIIGDGE